MKKGIISTSLACNDLEVNINAYRDLQRTFSQMKETETEQSVINLLFLLTNICSEINICSEN